MTASTAERRQRLHPTATTSCEIVHVETHHVWGVTTAWRRRGRPCHTLGAAGSNRSLITVCFALLKMSGLSSTAKEDFISDRANTCQLAFRSLLSGTLLASSKDLVVSRGLQHEYGRFRIWASNIAAITNPSFPNLSLDYRLREVADVKESFLAQLDIIDGSLGQRKLSLRYFHTLQTYQLLTLGTHSRRSTSQRLYRSDGFGRIFFGRLGQKFKLPR